MWQQMLEYLQYNMDTWLRMIGEHISISLISLVAALLIAVPAGCLCVRYGRSKKFVVSIFQILRIVPSLAILLLLIPVMGTGVRPAVTALTILAVPPILMNTITGLEEVPDFILETSYSCGMTGGQVWRKVWFPLAMPMILTGLRTAMIEVIASATLAAKIGAGGLGEIIFTGLGLDRLDLLLIGGITVALLTVAAGLLLELPDRVVMRYQYTNRNRRMER